MKRARPGSQAETLQTGKIHKLPGKLVSILAMFVHKCGLTDLECMSYHQTVRVFYNLPDSAFSYTTTLSNSQDVFIHRQPRKKHEQSSIVNGNGGGSVSGSTISRNNKRTKRSHDGDANDTQTRESEASDAGTSYWDGEDEDEEEQEQIYLGSVSLRAIVRAVCRAR